jgi:hypothetical protein
MHTENRHKYLRRLVNLLDLINTLGHIIAGQWSIRTSEPVQCPSHIFSFFNKKL